MEEPGTELPQSLVAIALDTNSMPNGMLNIDELVALSELIDAQELDVEIWIPEPVLWEWAEHIHRELVTAANTYRTAHRRALKAGLELGADSFEAGDLEETLQKLEERLDEVEHARVLRLSRNPAAAVAGLRDQVLQLRAGRRKPSGDSRVKTGGADSASWRLVEAEAGPDIQNVVLVTADGDSRAHFRGPSAPAIVARIWGVRQSLMRLQTGSQMAANEVREMILDSLPTLTEDILTGAEIENGRAAFRFDSDRYVETSVTLVGVPSVTDVRDIEVSRWDVVATAEARVEVDLRIEFVWWDERTESVEQAYDEAHSVPALVQVAATRSDTSSSWTVAVEHVLVEPN